jgi:3-hydroxyisobutyrate dehydrogenase
MMLLPTHVFRVPLNRSLLLLTKSMQQRCFSSNDGRVGFIGLGNMGLPMSLRLANNGVKVFAFDTNPGACEAASQAGIQIAESVSQIGQSSDCDLVFTMLPSCKAVDSVMDNLVQSTPESSRSRVFVDSSTVSPATSRKWHQVWSDKGHGMVDAPVSGGVKGAADGTLTFMVGSQSEEHLNKAKPYLEMMGKGVISCGGPGSGAATKLCNNVALAAQMVGICEAMNLGEALGVDPIVLADVMNSSTAKSWSCEVNNPHPAVAAKKGGSGLGPPASRDYEGGFATRLMLKDLGLAIASAEDVKVALPVTTASRELYRMAELRGFGQKDFGVLLKFLRGG